MTLSHNQHNKQLSHIAATGLPKGAKNTMTDKTRFAICFNTVYRRSKEFHLLFCLHLMHQSGDPFRLGET